MATPHTIAVAGKGGVGKTTACGMIVDGNGTAFAATRCPTACAAACPSRPPARSAVAKQRRTRPVAGRRRTARRTGDRLRLHECPAKLERLRGSIWAAPALAGQLFGTSTKAAAAS